MIYYTPFSSGQILMFNIGHLFIGKHHTSYVIVYQLIMDV